MAAVPIYVWNGTAWQETGPVIPASPIKYQASAPSSPSTGDIWVDSDGDVTTGSQQFQRFRFVASGGETSISGVDANGATLAYTAGTEIVALNGSTLVRGQDYTATNGTSITGLSPALVANDVVEVFSFMAFNVANTYTQTQVDGFVTSLGGTDTAWTSWTPTTTGWTIGNGTFTAKYKKIGKTVFIRVHFKAGSTTTFSGAGFSFTLPSTPNVTTDYVQLTFPGVGHDVGTSVFNLHGIVGAGNTDMTIVNIQVWNASGTYVTANDIASTVPMTWTTNDKWTVSGFYEEV